MRPPENAIRNGYIGNGWFWKPVSISLLTALITGAGFVLYLGYLDKGYVTRSEASEMIRTQAPYIKDRKYIIESLKDIKRNIEIIKTSLYSRGGV